MATSYSRSRKSCLLSSIPLLLLSIITISLYASILAFISDPVVGQSEVINFARQAFPVLEVLPQNLNDASLKLTIASGIICLLVSSVCTVFALMVWSNGKRIYPVSPTKVITYSFVFNAFLSLASMVYLQVAHFRSSVFHPDYRGVSALYDEGIFDFESWACQVSGYDNNFPQRLCRTAVAGRVVAILSCIGALAAVAVMALATRREKKDALQRLRNEKRSNDAEFESN